MGDVWLAARDDGAYDGEVAVKVLRPAFGHASVLARFADEQRALARLVHPNIARLLDAGRTADGQPYFVMEFLVGESLQSRLKQRGRLSQKEAVAIGESLAQALSAAHKAGIIHRDLKPDFVSCVAGWGLEGSAGRGRAVGKCARSAWM